MVSPEIWGPPYWKYLHILTLCYEKESSSEQKKQLFVDFSKNIPCEDCKRHFVHLLENEIDFEKHTAFHISVHLHNRVNERLNKGVLYTEDEARQELLHPPSKHGTSTGTVFGMLLLLLVFLFCVFVYWKSKPVDKIDNFSN